MSLGKLFEISKRSLLTYQRALSVTSNNVANANNAEYSRQRVMFATETPDYSSGISFGNGVKITDVLRVRSELVDSQIRSYSSKLYSTQKDATIYGNIESLLSEPSDLGISSLLNSFFNSWDELATNPSSVQLRTNTVQSAEKLAGKISNIYEGLTEIRTDTRNEIYQTVDDLNNLTSQLNTLNKQIYEASITNYSANDLLDQRDSLLEQMSQLANISVNIDSDNVANVSVGGVFVVDRLNAVKLEVNETGSGISVTTEDEAASIVLNGGTLNSLLNAHKNVIPDYIKQLDSVVNQLMTSVNSIHQTGYSNTDPSVTGIDFFESYKNGELVINQDIVDNPNLIATSADGTSGNNEIALKLAELNTSKLSSGMSISDMYSNFVSDVGSKKQFSDEIEQSYNLVLTQLNSQQAEQSGVSTDEEMIDIIKFQRSYDASARLIKIADELLQTLMDMV
jgi:flagellar hook-associated protein 1